MDRAQELRKLIWEHEKMYKKRKNKLAIKTWVVLSFCFYAIAFMCEMMQEPIDYLTNFVLSFIFAGIFIYVAILVMTPLLNMREREVSEITRLKIKLENIEKGQP